MTPLLFAVADVADQSLAQWSVGAVAAGILGVLAFLVRHAFARVETALESVSAKLDSMASAIAKADGDKRVLEARLDSLQREVTEIKREVREVSEGIAR